MEQQRLAGILLHVSSLPKGSLVEHAGRFITLLEQSGVAVWQMLPLGPRDFFGSPYASPSAFASDPKLLEGAEAVALDEQRLAEYIIAQPWVEDWALFCALKQAHNQVSWLQWPLELRARDAAALAQARQSLADEIRHHISVQAALDEQWSHVRHLAAEAGLLLFGDMPFFVALESADVWANPSLFDLDDDWRPRALAGVPPDYFSPTGQMWGNPLYLWAGHRSESFAWWRARVRRLAEQFDLLRIDHFRAFDSCWAIPAGASDARSGRWEAGPGSELLDALLTEVGGMFVAEDLGIIPQSVSELARSAEVPGMVVLQFAFDDDNPQNPHLPQNHVEDSVCYTGTHDNDTSRGWYEATLDSSTVEHHQRRKAGLDRLASAGERASQTLIRLALESPSRLAIIPMQDVLDLDGSHRMNTPGTLAGNWRWRFAWDEIEQGRLEWLASALAATSRQR